MDEKITGELMVCEDNQSSQRVEMPRVDELNSRVDYNLFRFLWIKDVFSVISGVLLLGYLLFLIMRQTALPFWTASVVVGPIFIVRWCYQRREESFQLRSIMRHSPTASERLYVNARSTEHASFEIIPDALREPEEFDARYVYPFTLGQRLIGMGLCLTIGAWMWQSGRFNSITFVLIAVLAWVIVCSLRPVKFVLIPGKLIIVQLSPIRARILSLAIVDLRDAHVFIDLYRYTVQLTSGDTRMAYFIGLLPRKRAFARTLIQSAQSAQDIPAERWEAFFADKPKC